MIPRWPIASPSGGACLRLGLVLAVLLLAVQWLFMWATVNGTSMAPTLRNGQLALIFNQAYRFGLPKRGDLVLVSTGKELLIKRILGLPGEELRICQSRAYVDGQPLPEPYLKRTGHWEVGAGRIGPGRYAIVGDNRSGVQGDSLLAIVKKDRILGKVICY